VHKTSVDLVDGELVERRWIAEDMIPLMSNKSIYIPGDAIVYGNFTDYTRITNNDQYPSSNIRMFGHGTISGSKILHYEKWYDYTNNK
jgi:hypothetical protein